MLEFTLPKRTSKKRSMGLTNLVDNGYTTAHLNDVLSMNHPFVDLIKIGWASAYITPNLIEKVKLFRQYDIVTCLGGMMFELSYWQNKVDEYIAFLQEHEIDHVEVSNGSLPITELEKCEMVTYFKNKGFTVLSEVGSKDITVNTPPEEWVASIKRDLDAGASKVLLEGRADASAGIYHSDGVIKFDLIEKIFESDVDINDVIIEAPKKPQIAWFIKQVGPNVNLGNVPVSEIQNTECLRLGLRGDTVKHFNPERVTKEKETLA